MTNTKDIVTRNLDRFGYTYTERAQTIEVKHPFNLRTTIDLSQEGKVLLTDRLVGWNSLMGLIPAKDLTTTILYTWRLLGFIGAFAGALLANKALWAEPSAGIRWATAILFISIVAMLSMTSAVNYYLTTANTFRNIVTRWAETTAEQGEPA